MVNNAYLLYPRYSVVLGTHDKVIDHMIEQKTNGDVAEGTYSELINIMSVLNIIN